MKTFASHLNEELSMDDFVSFASNHLKLKDEPKIKFVQEKDEDMSSACYNPNDKSIKILSKDRRFMDIARSVAHEMVHHMQNLDGRLNPKSGEDGSDDENETKMKQMQSQEESFACTVRRIQSYTQSR